MKQNFIIYGCNGYTGKLICEHAVNKGLKPVIAGRDKASVENLARQLNLEYRVFDLSNEQTVVDNIKDFVAVLHCAGPFKFTSQVMVNACLKAKTHYLDITGEYQVFESLFDLNDAAVQAGILVMPGVGFDVVPTDCLSLYLKEVLPTATTLELALYQKGAKLSHGTAITIAENIGEKTVIRKSGKLVQIANGSLTKYVEVDGQERNSAAISWGDVSTAFRTTRIPNITVYNVLPEKVIASMQLTNTFGFFFRLGIVRNYLKRRIKQRPAGPNEEQRKAARSIIWGEVRNPLGVAKRAVLELPEGYNLTAWTAVEIAKQVCNNPPEPGTRTPASVFGKDFILQFEGVKRTDQDATIKRK